MGERKVAVLYLDLDGTVRHGVDELKRFVHGPADVVVFPEAVIMMRRWREAGGRIVGVTNQGGVALGHVSPARVRAAIMETQRQCEGLFDVVHACFHHPGAADPEMARCWCRKPSAGAVVETVHALCTRVRSLGYWEYYPPHLGLFVGDRPEDEECARSASLDFKWAAEWRAGVGS